MGSDSVLFKYLCLTVSVVLPEFLSYNPEKYEIRLTSLTEIQQKFFQAELNKVKQKTTKAVQTNL